MSKQEMLEEMLNRYLEEAGPSQDGYNGTDVPKSIYLIFESMAEVIKVREDKLKELSKDIFHE